jgi:hypothetical protein
MFAANTYRIRPATDEDTDALRSLAARNSQQPLEGSVLIGEIDGIESAALSLDDGRVIADCTPRADHLVSNMRIRAVGIWANSATPSLRDRLLAGLPVWYRAVSIEPTHEAEQEAALVQA